MTIKIERDSDGNGYTIRDRMDVNGVVHESEFWIRNDALAELSAEAFARLCEMNTEKKGAKCVCVMGYGREVCAEFTEGHPDEGVCCTPRRDGTIEVCGHNKACHTPPQGAKP